MTDTATPASRPMRKDAARNRALLLAAAGEVFAQRGLDASLDDVAHQAGLGVGTAYRHFANKFELISALMDQMIDEFIAAAEHTLTIEDPWLALVAFLDEAITIQANDRGLRQVLMGVHDPAKFDQVHERLTGLVAELLQRAQRAGVVRADAEGSDIGFIVTMLCAAADAAADTSPTLWRRYLAMCLEGLKPGAVELPEIALSDADFRKAMANHKQSLARPNNC